MEKQAWKVWAEVITATGDNAVVSASDLMRVGRVSDLVAVEVIKRALESAAQSTK